MHVTKSKRKKLFAYEISAGTPELSYIYYIENTLIGSLQPEIVLVFHKKNLPVTCKFPTDTDFPNGHRCGVMCMRLAFQLFTFIIVVIMST